MTSEEEDDAEAERVASEWGVPLRDQRGDLDGLWLGMGDRPLHWIEDERWRPIPAPLLVWAEYMECSRRVVRQDEPDKRWFRGHHLVSTIFLGIDHNFGLHGPPLLYETMIFRHGAMQAFLERLELHSLIGRWERFRRKAHYKWDIPLPSIWDSTGVWQRRYATRADALGGHLGIVEMVCKGVPSHQWGEPD